ncbi:MAG TPA: Fic family protein, partial [Frankiaceae bacterium]|nr:Fic family protein [Frankiaceae bacterium]
MSERSTGSGPSWDPAVADADHRSFADFPSWAGCRVDRVVWDAYLGDLRRERERTSEAAQRHAIDVAIRSAAFETGAVEGLYETTRGITHTIAVQAAAWDLALEKPGPLGARLFEAALRTYELVLDAATHRTPVSEAWPRRVQEELCRPQETYRVHTPLGWQDRPLVLGRYETEPNHVVLPDGSRHAYAPVHRVADEMHRLVAQLGTPAFDAAHPVLQAAYAHHALTAVHPFADGNGRTARALASVYLYRAARVPLLV